MEHKVPRPCHEVWTVRQFEKLVDNRRATLGSFSMFVAVSANTIDKTIGSSSVEISTLHRQTLLILLCALSLQKIRDHGSPQYLAALSKLCLL